MTENPTSGTATALASALSFATTVSLAATRPNILFILADDLGWGDVGFTGRNSRNAEKPAIRTPTLDRLAAEGVVLTDHVCAAPVCAPSRASILTGLRQGRCSVSDNNFDAPISETRTLASVLKGAGYATYAVGKWGVGGGGGSGLPFSAHPLDRGFDHYYGFPFHIAGHTYYHFDGRVNDIWMGVMEDRTNATASAERVYSTDLFTARAKRYLVDHVAASTNQPFFMYLAVNTVHGSGMLADEIVHRETLHVPAGPYPEGGGLSGGVVWPVAKSTADVCNTWIDPAYAALDPKAARYATAIARLDRAMADLMKTLEDLGIADDTLVVVTSDNGPAGEYGADTRFFASAGPFDGMKRDVFEGGMRVPTFVRWPGRIASGRDAEPSISYDWLATFADIAGVRDAAAGTDGVSLLPRWLGGGGEVRRSLVYTQYFGPDFGGGDYAEIKARKAPVRGRQQMLRRGNLVAVRTQMKSLSDPVRVYDVVKDPFQEHPLPAAESDSLREEMNRLFVGTLPVGDFGMTSAGGCEGDGEADAGQARTRDHPH